MWFRGIVDLMLLVTYFFFLLQLLDVQITVVPSLHKDLMNFSTENHYSFPKRALYHLINGKRLFNLMEIILHIKIMLEFLKSVSKGNKLICTSNTLRDNKCKVYYIRNVQ